VNVVLLVLLVATVAATILGRHRRTALALHAREDQKTVLQSLQDLAAAFHLTMQIDPHPLFDLLAKLHRQPGLDFDITVEMEGDELHLSVGPHLALEVWTHNHPERISEAIENIRGLLTGQYRLVVYSHGETRIGTELQGANSGEWEVVGGWWGGAPPGTKREQLVQEVLQNALAR
jgi:hypothetical protein